jgi:hypothetical protein
MTRTSAVAWWPESLETLQGQGSTDLSYVVLEEVVDAVVVLVAWPWPLADDQGRLFWPGSSTDDSRAASIERDLLRFQLYRPNRLNRMPRAGDVFASTALGAGWGHGRCVDDVRALFAGRVFDISAEAREAAKLAYQGAVATVPRPNEADDDDVALLADAAHRRSRFRARELRLSSPPRDGRRAS